MIGPQPTSTGHHRCAIHYEKGTITRVQENQVFVSPFPLISLIYILFKATSHLTYERLYIMLQKNSSTTHNLVVAHTIPLSYPCPKGPLGTKPTWMLNRLRDTILTHIASHYDHFSLLSIAHIQTISNFYGMNSFFHPIIWHNVAWQSICSHSNYIQLLHTFIKNS